jgi:hypothetical protein
MHVLYVGSAGSSYPLWIGRALVDAGNRFSFLNYSPSFFEPAPEVITVSEGRFLNLRTGPEDVLSEERAGFRRRISGLLHRLGLSPDRAQEQRLRRWLDALDVDVAFSHWGTVALPAVACLKRARPSLPVVHEFLSYPTDWFGAAEKVNGFYRSLIEGLAGRIYCSDAMRAYFTQRFEPGVSLETVRRSRYPRRAFPREWCPRPRATDRPRVVCLATHDYYRRPGDVNDVLPRLRRIADAGIEVHALRPPGDAESRARLRWFDRMDPTDGALATFATQFDACLVTYNLDDPRLDRTQFQTSMPERFLYALVLGIPLVLPTGDLLSCETLVLKNEIGLTFRTEGELADRLRDTDLMERLRQNAQVFSRVQALEDDLPDLLEFLRRAAEHYRHAIPH